VRLERVRSRDLPPVWLIARSTVANADALYERYGPSRLERAAPDWAVDDLGETPLWRWLAIALLMAASVGVGVVLQRIAARLMRASGRIWLRGLASEVAGPLASLGAVATFWLAYTGLPWPPPQWAAAVLTVLFVAALTWLGTSVVDFFSEYIGKRHVDRVAHQDNRRARRRLTYLSVARRAFVVLVVIVGAGVALAQFGTLRTLGASLLASAGVAGILVGIAAQGPLSNLIAGVQIALTQLVQIGDTVYYEGDYAYVEDVTYTFVVLRTWDERRIAVPNRHVISHPLENWEMTSSHLVMPIRLYVDFRTPVDEVRRRYVELLEASDAWDREQAPSLLVREIQEDVLELQALCSAADPDAAWHLACHLREELLAFLRAWEDGRYLPRKRVQVDERTPDRDSKEDTPA
jgi:small-conductance mechanosensitive channel